MIYIINPFVVRAPFLGGSVLAATSDLGDLSTLSESDLPFESLERMSSV